MDAVSKLLSYCYIWLRGFHPQQVGKLAVLDASLGAELDIALQLEVAFVGAARVPVKFKFESEGFGELLGLV